MKDKHTPTPWRVGPDQSSVKVGRYNVVPYVTAGGTAKGMIDEREVVHANAEFIVHACNNHDELVKRLAWAIRFIEIYATKHSGPHTPELNKARAALAAAGEQS